MYFACKLTMTCCIVGLRTSFLLFILPYISFPLLFSPKISPQLRVVHIWSKNKKRDREPAFFYLFLSVFVRFFSLYAFCTVIYVIDFLAIIQGRSLYFILTMTCCIEGLRTSFLLYILSYSFLFFFSLYIFC